MHAHKVAALVLAGLTVAVLGLAQSPAQAQSGLRNGPDDGAPSQRRVVTAKKKAVAPEQVASAARPPARVTVRRRSFLDPGTETRTHAEHSLDYAFPPGNPGTFTADPNNRTINWTRMPFPDCFDLPGFCRPW